MKQPLSIVTSEDNMQMMARYPDGFFDLAALVTAWRFESSSGHHIFKNTFIKQSVAGEYLKVTRKLTHKDCFSKLFSTIQSV